MSHDDPMPSGGQRWLACLPADGKPKVPRRAPWRHGTLAHSAGRAAGGRTLREASSSAARQLGSKAPHRLALLLALRRHGGGRGGGAARTRCGRGGSTCGVGARHALQSLVGRQAGVCWMRLICGVASGGQSARALWTVDQRGARPGACGLSPLAGAARNNTRTRPHPQALAGTHTRERAKDRAL